MLGERWMLNPWLHNPEDGQIRIGLDIAISLPARKRLWKVGLVGKRDVKIQFGL
jgi:hypothetical protein